MGILAGVLLRRIKLRCQDQRLNIRARELVASGILDGIIHDLPVPATVSQLPVDGNEGVGGIIAVVLFDFGDEDWDTFLMMFFDPYRNKV